VPESRVVGGDQVIAIREAYEEWLEHSRLRRKPVQQEECRHVFRTGLSVKDGEPINLRRAIQRWIFHVTFLSPNHGPWLSD